MKIPFLAAFTMKKAYQRGFKDGSILWKVGFIFVAIFKILKYLFSKPKPKTFAQYDLEPGEYKVVVSKPNKNDKK